MPKIPKTERPALQERFDNISAQTSVALAVSGGVDSMALLYLAHEWRETRLRLKLPVPDFTVLTVDHGLRKEALEECRFVKSKAGELGYAAEILRWSGEVPQTKVQETARDIRYQLLAGACHMRGIRAIMTAHHLDDQAETFLMRLGRGSGVDGLAAMAFESRRYGVTLVRPLLDVAKAELLQVLEQAGWPYREDPGNLDPRYERVRLRTRKSELRKLGLTPEKICLAARRLRRARTALEQARDEFLREHALITDYGSARIDQLALHDAPDEIAIRALSKVLKRCGGSLDVPNLARLETLMDKLKDDFATNRTLAGCRIIAKGDFWLIVREAGRILEQQKPVETGDCMFWDNRYIICADKDMRDAIMAGPLGDEGELKELVEESRLKRLPFEALASLLAFRCQGEVIAVPALDFWSERALKAGLQAKLITSDDGVI